MEIDRKKIRNARLFRLKDLFSHYGLNLISLSYFVFFSTLFIFIWFVLKSFFDTQIMRDFSTSDSQTKQVMINHLFANQVLFGLIFIPLIIVTFMLLSGCIYLSYKINTYERENYFATFFYGVKTGFKYSLVAGLFVALIYNIVNVLLFYQTLSNIFIYYIVFIFSALVLFPIITIILYEGVIYNPKLLVAIKNGCIIYFRFLLYCMILLPLIALPIILIIVFKNEIWVYILFIILSAFIFGFLLTIISEMIIDMFDETVNKFYYPKNYLKGLNIPND